MKNEKIIKGKIFSLLPENKIIAVIDKVAHFYKNKGFLYFDSVDIEQQAKLICWNKINEFDPRRKKIDNIEEALEHWLNRIVSNRLKNLYRDHVGIVHRDFKRDTEFTKECRINLLNPVNIAESYNLCDIDLNSTEFKELLQIIVDNIDHELFDVLEALLSGENIGDYYKKKLFIEVTKILKNVREREYE